jgi:hypothetical protein
VFHEILGDDDAASKHVNTLVFFELFRKWKFGLYVFRRPEGHLGDSVQILGFPLQGHEVYTKLYIEKNPEKCSF